MKKLKKKDMILIAVLIIIILLVIPVMINCIQLKNSGTKPKEVQSDVLVVIDNKNKNCEHQSLTLYKDGTYQLYTAHAEPLFFMAVDTLQYTKSKVGKYHYDISKIINNCTASDAAHIDNDHFPEYELRYYGEDGNPQDYFVEHGQVNKELEEFLKKHNIDLNKCSIKDYSYYLTNLFTHYFK